MGWRRGGSRLTVLSGIARCLWRIGWNLEAWRKGCLMGLFQAFVLLILALVLSIHGSCCCTLAYEWVIGFGIWSFVFSWSCSGRKDMDGLVWYFPLLAWSWLLRCFYCLFHRRLLFGHISLYCWYLRFMELRNGSLLFRRPFCRSFHAVVRSGVVTTLLTIPLLSSLSETPSIVYAIS